MNDQAITVVYRWTANEGKLDELKSIYEEVLQQMQETEPDALMMQCYIDEEANALIVHDLFKDGAALGAHLGGTAAQHFPKLAAIAVPGPFFFCGDVPPELKQAAESMNMGAQFGTNVFGFERTA